MSIITDTSFFSQDKKVPETDVNKPYGEYLKDRIAALEPSILVDVLGYEMYQDFNANTEASSGLWYDFINGKEFTDKLSRENFWPGFRDSQWSFVSYFVYYNVLREKQHSVTTLGITQAAHENASPANPNELLSSTWNKMVDILWIMDDFLRQNKSVYTKYIGLQYPPFKITNYDTAGYSNNKYFQKINPLDI